MGNAFNYAIRFLAGIRTTVTLLFVTDGDVMKTKDASGKTKSATKSNEALR